LPVSDSAGDVASDGAGGGARAASDLGFRTVVVADACSAGSPEAHSASLESLGLLAEITTTEEFLAGLQQPAAANA
jgi:nicotinamidase-related amidase